jgi:hypothetical protein
VRALLAAALVLVPALALAQRSPQADRKQEVVFGPDDVIDGNRTGPDMSFVEARPSAIFKNLIKLRKDFNDKIRSEQLQ